MSRKNPTGLLVEMSGVLDGRRYTVRGRVVLSVKVEGEAYYWNEYRLVDGTNEEVTLVFEEEEEGPTWKLFRLFDPVRPMTASEAARVKVGDQISIDGLHGRVSFMDVSRVVYTEGQPPEGVEVGDVANYFNADVGAEMIVVSWSGDEVEFYRGQRISARRIETGFHLERGAARGSSQFERRRAGKRWWEEYPIVQILFAVVGVSAFIATRWEPRPSRPPAKIVATASRLRLGGSGVIAGNRYTLVAHALVEVARPKQKFERHEYVLAAADGDHVLLVNALTGGSHAWHLLRTQQPPSNFSAFDAAAIKSGGVRTVAGEQLDVIQLFAEKVTSRDGVDAKSGWPEEVQYGLVGRRFDDWEMLRWTEHDLQFLRGRAVPEDEVLRAFGEGSD